MIHVQPLLTYAVNGLLILERWADNDNFSRNSVVRYSGDDTVQINTDHSSVTPARQHSASLKH